MRGTQHGPRRLGEEHLAGWTSRKASRRRVPLHGPPWSLGTWSQFLELPFSNYLTALMVGTFVSGGTGAEVRKDRCVKPSGLHNSSQTQKSKLCFVGKRRTSLFISLWLTPGCLSPVHPGIMLRQLLAPPPTPAAHVHARGLVGAAPNPPHPHPGRQLLHPICSQSLIVS